LAITHVQAAEAVQRRGQATTPDRAIPRDEPVPAARPPGLAASGSALIPGARRQADDPRLGPGRRFGDGGNLLAGWFVQTPGEPTSMTVDWWCPPGVEIDFGDGEQHQVGGVAERVRHTYDEPPPGTPAPWIFEARIVDQYGRLRGSRRFILPHGENEGVDVASIVANTVPSP
jgi:hypothetical protein